MKYFKLSMIAALLLVLFTNNSCDDLPELITEVSGTIIKTASYCGGAAPTDEILAELATPAPYIGTLYLKQGTINDPLEPALATITTDENGDFSIVLAEGDYIIVTAEHLGDYTNDYPWWPDVSSEYCQNWLATPYISFTVNDAYTPTTYNIHLACNPCVPPPPGGH